VVKPGILYRSGQLNPDQLAAAVARHGIRTVVSFQIYGRGVEAERELARSLGVDFVNLPMSGDGFGREDQFREVLAACDDPQRRPVLVHCARGTCRTGASVALYRFERDGWTIEDVSAEMERQTYRHGWLPGYVFNMVREKPQTLYLTDRPVLIDANRPTQEARDAR
jgi:protein tyrosine/serine phosphatase